MADKATGAGKPNARGMQRRHLILNAAVNVVARGGSGALTHRAAASEAGVSLASVTYHFPSIETLRRATLSYVAESLGADFAESIQCDGEGAALQKLAERWRTIGLTRQAEFVALFSLLVDALHDPDLRGDISGLLAIPVEILTREGVREPVAQTIVGSLVGLALTALARSKPEQALSQFDDSVEVLLKAFSAGYAGPTLQGGELGDCFSD